MKITVNRNHLLKTLTRSQGVVEKRTTVPILSNVLLEATDQGLVVSATDLEIGFKETVVAEIEDMGATTVSAFMLYDIVRKLKDGAPITIAFEKNEGKVTVASGRSTFTLGCLPVEDFTPVKTGEDLPHRFTIEARKFIHLIDCTRFSMSTDEARYFLNGIYFHVLEDKKNVLRAVATDGHRLAMTEVEVQGVADLPAIIVGRKAINEIRKLIDQGEGELNISLSENLLSCSYDGAVFTTRLIEGNYPAYANVIPSANDNDLHVETKEFADAVDRVALLSAEKNRAVKLNISPSSMTVSAVNAEQGSAVEEMEVEYSASPLQMGFNPKYLLDVAQHIKGDMLQFRLSNSATPVVIQDKADQQATYVLMPMRV